MTVESATKFPVGDLGHVSIECGVCGTAIDLPLRPPPQDREDAAHGGPPPPHEQFQRWVRQPGGVACQACAGRAGQQPLLRLPSTYENERHGPVNRELAELVLAVMEAAAVTEGADVRIRGLPQNLWVERRAGSPRQTHSVPVCSPPSRRVAPLRPRCAGLTAWTPAARTSVPALV